MSKAAPGAVYGVILIAVMFLMPMGAGGFLYAIWRRITGARGAPPPQSPTIAAVSYDEVLPVNTADPREPELVERADRVRDA